MYDAGSPEGRRQRLAELEQELIAATAPASSTEAPPSTRPSAGRRVRDSEVAREAVGTKGLGSFLLGLVLAAVGGYLLTNQVVVGSGPAWWWGPNTFGLTLVPVLLGIGLLAFKGSSWPGWMLTVGGAAVLMAGVLANLHVAFRPTSLFNTLLMLGLLASGLGLMARGLRRP